MGKSPACHFKQNFYKDIGELVETKESGHVRLGESYCMELHSSNEVAIGEKGTHVPRWSVSHAWCQSQS